MENRLRQVRQALGWTQTQVARRLDISRGHYAHIEAGDKEPSLQLAFRLAKIMHQQIEYLFPYDEDISKEEIG